jgi:hypothetical protein
MKVRALDINGDWQFGRGLQSYKTEKDALNQNISTRLKSWENDCFFAMDEGIDYENYLDIGTKEFLDLDIKRCLLQTEGVLRIDSYSSTINASTRDVTITAEVFTIFGTMTVSG